MDDSVNDFLQKNESFRQKITDWANSEKSLIQQQSEDFQKKDQVNKTEIQTLEEKKKDALNRLKLLSEENAMKANLVTASKTEVSNLRAEVESLRPVLATLSQTQASESDRLEALRIDLLRKQKEREYQVNELTKGILQYKKLGLSLERIGEKDLAVIFTQIDPTEPDKPFSFRLSINETTDDYNIVECQPSLQDISSLTESLNQTGDLGDFVRSIRKRFKSLATP